MKLIRQTSLSFRQGTSDKVYDVDLCEVAPDRFVVNFRFGRRGAALQEGSKTALPVSRVEADRIFDKLVAEKKSKGYIETAPGSTASPLPGSSPQVRFEDIEDPREARMRELLRDPSKGWTQNLEKLVWRTGELRVKDSAPLLVSMVDGASDRLVWNLARAWWRLGDPSVLPALRSLWARKSLAQWARSMVAHAMSALLEGEARDQFIAELSAGIDAPFMAAFETDKQDAIIAALRKNPDSLDTLYITTHGDDTRRAKLIELLKSVPLDAAFRGIRRVWKAAETSGDIEIFGLLARRFEIEQPNNARGRKAGFQPGTKKWLRRRTWRTMSRLGSAGLLADYCDLATSLLLSFNDRDARASLSRSIGYDYRTRTNIEVWSGRYSHLWALSKILYGNSQRLFADCSSLSFRTQHGKDPRQPSSDREEAFPHAWDAAPEQLALLLDRSRCDEVHVFAARALKSNRDAWGRIPVRRLIGWFSAPYPATTELAAEVALTRYDPNDPDLDLILALLSCLHERPRNLAISWVKANPGVFLSSVSFVVGLVLNEQQATRALALELLGGTPMLPEHARQVVSAVIAAAQRSEVKADEEDARQQTARLRDAASVLIAAFSREIAVLPLETVANLIRHPVAGVAELGAKILLGHQTRPVDLPDDLLAAAMTSPHPLVRGIGIRLYGELPDVVLAERFRVLVHLITNPFPDVRVAVAPIVVRLANGNRPFAKILLSALIPILVAGGPEGMHRDLIRLLRTELSPILSAIEPAHVFRLLRAEETVVQEFGGELLRTNVDPASMTPAQLAVLANSEVLAVRRTAMIMLSARVDAIKTDPESILPILDARWEDSRQSAFAFVENTLGFENVTPEVALAVCDSVRQDVQLFGRKIVVNRFSHEDGARYLLRLAQHPSLPMQEFAATWLEQHAAGSPERLARLVPFFVGVLLRPNQGRVAKARVLAFLDSQLEQRETAEIVASIASELVLTSAKSHQARYVEMLNTIRKKHEGIFIPLRLVQPEVRGAV